MTSAVVLSMVRTGLAGVLVVVAITGGIAGVVSLFLMPAKLIPIALTVVGFGLFLAVVFDITSRATNGKPLIWWSRPWQVLLVLAAAFTNAIAAMNAGLYLGLCLVVVAVLICRALAKAAQRLYSRRRA